MIKNRIEKNKKISHKVLAMAGIFLKKGEVTHHIDGNIDNNLITNLMVMTVGEHTKLHHAIRKAMKL